MPRIRGLSEREAAFLKKRGLDPAQYAVSLDNPGQLYDLTKMEAPGLGENIASGLRSVTAGALSAPVMGLHALGGLVEGGTKLVQRPFVGPDATGWRGLSEVADAADQTVQEFTGEDPRVSKFVSIPGRAVGQVGSLMTGVGLAGNAMRLTPLGARVLGSVTGAGMAAGDTIDEELKRQERAGEERAIGQAVGKGAIVGTASVPLEWMGVGRLLGSADDAALRAMTPTRRLLSVGGRSAGTEGVEEGLQYGVVEGPEGTFDPNVALERVAGGALGGFVGGGAGALGMDVSPFPGEATASDEKAIVDQAKALAQSKNTNYEIPSETIDAMEAAIRTDTIWKPVGKLNPVDSIFEELRKAKVPLLREDIEGLYKVWGGNNANLNQLQETGRKLYERGVSGRTGKVIPTPDLVAKQQDELEKYDNQIANVRKRYDALTKAMAEEDTKLASAPAGDRWQALAARDRALRANEIAQLETQMETLVAQKELMLGKQRDTRGDVNRPVIAGESGRGRSYPVMNPEERMEALQALPSVQGEVQTPIVPRPLEGVPIEEGNITPQSFPPVVSPLDAEAAAQQQAAEQQAAEAAPWIKAAEPIAPQAAEAVARAQARMAELTQRAAELERDPRRQSPIVGIRQQVEDEAAQIEAELEQEAVAATRPPLKPDRSVVDAFMQGKPIPGMEGEQGLPFEDEGSEGETKVYNSGLPLEVIQNLFDRLKKAQRGRPETLGTRFPRLFQGSIDYPLEHVGDLVHRLAYTERDGGGIDYGREAAQTKIKRALRYAEDAQRAGGLLPFVKAVAKRNFDWYKSDEGKEFAEATLPATFEEAWPILRQHLNDYALSHSELPAMSEYQKLAQEATVALGRLDTETYVAKLKELDTKLKADNWKEKWYAEPEAEERWGNAGRKAAKRVERALSGKPSGNRVNFEQVVSKHVREFGFDPAKLELMNENSAQPVLRLKLEDPETQEFHGTVRFYPSNSQDAVVREYDMVSADAYDVWRPFLEAEVEGPAGLGLINATARQQAAAIHEVVMAHQAELGDRMKKVDHVGWLKRAYKKVAEARDSYKKAKVIPKDELRKGTAGFYNPNADVIGARPRDKATVLHETVHRVNHYMGAAISDQLIEKAKERTSGNIGDFGALFGESGITGQAGEMAFILADISPIYYHLWTRLSKNSKNPLYDIRQIVDEALAQVIAERVYSGGELSEDHRDLDDILYRLGFDTNQFAHALDTEAGRPRWNSYGNTYYSGIPVDLFWRGLKEFGSWSKGKLRDANFNPFDALYYGTRSVKSTLSGLHPLAAYIAHGMDGMWRMRDQLENRKMAELDEFKEFLANPEVVSWINDSIDNQTEDYTALPAELRPVAERFMEFNRSFIQGMIDRDQYVRTGNDAPRLPEMIPGFVPTAVSKHVWDELSSGDPAMVDKWQKIWVDSWRNQRPQDSEEQALAAFEDFAKPVTAVHAIGGEPLFSAARKAHGINLPREMREQNIYAGYQRYISKSARDTVWTEKVQKDPLMRRALGVKLDHHFEDHSAEDRLVQPTELQWRKMLRQGRRVNAKWMANLKPGQNLGLPLLVRNESVGDVFLASFNETPANRIAPLDRGFNDFSQLAGSLLMETTTGIRDATFGNTELAAYVPSSALVKRWGEVVSDYAKYRDKARKAGAVRADVYRHQAADVMSKAAYKTAKTIRDVTGRQLLDEYPRVFAYHAVYEQVMSDLKNSGNSPLVDEFGEIGDNLSFEEQAEATAAAVVNRIAPNYDVRSLPKAWVPQTRGLVGMLTQLSTFGVARYNTWYEDHYQPAIRDGKPGRLMRSALFGVVGAAAAGALIDELFKKKPAKMSWQEWMGLSTEEQQKEFAPLLFGLIQSQGMLGIMGDLTLPLVQFGNRLATGGGPPVSFPDLGEAAIPGVIIMDQVLMTAADFVQYASSKGWKIDKYDFADLGNEFMKTAQVWRDMQGWFSDSERDVSRERRTYERLSGKSAVTEEPIERPLMSQIVPRLGTRFSVSREFNTRQGPALQSLMPVIEERAMQGKEVRIASRDFTDEFWQDVARRRGLNTAKAMYEKVQKQREYEPIRRDLAGRLNSVR